MIAGYIPDKEKKLQQIFRLISEEYEAKDLITKCLNTYPDNRPSVKLIMQHKFFKDIDWDQVRNKELHNFFVPDLDNPFDTKYFQGNVLS